MKTKDERIKNARKRIKVALKQLWSLRNIQVSNRDRKELETFYNNIITKEKGVIESLEFHKTETKKLHNIKVTAPTVL